MNLVKEVIACDVSPVAMFFILIAGVVKNSAFAESIDIKMSFGRLLHWMLVFAQGRYLCRDILQLILSGLLVGIIWQARKEELVAMAGNKNPW